MSTTQTIPSFTNADFGTRMDVLKQLANATGIRLPNTIVPEGESLIPYGEERKRQLQDDIYALPTLNSAYQTLRDIRAEQEPRDVRVPLQRVRMNATNGGLYGVGSEGKPTLGYTNTAFAQVAQVIKPASVTAGFASTLAALPPPIRAQAFNHFAETKAGGTSDQQVILRTLRAPMLTSGGMTLRRSINAVVSERYSAVDDHDLVRDLGNALPDGARVRITQTESRTDIEIIWPAMSRQLKVGDIALITIQITNSQTKQSSILLVPKLLRVLCLNFTTAWAMGDTHEVSTRHTGDARYKFQRAVRDCITVVEPFVVAFADAYQAPLPAFAPTRGEAINHFVKAFEFAPKLGESIAASWDMDGSMSAGDTLAGLANAVTRASQTMAFGQADGVEAAAGRLVREGWDGIAD